LSILGITMLRLRRKDTRQIFRKINWMGTFLSIMAQHRILRQAGGIKAQVQLNESDSDSWHQTRCHIHPEPRQWYPVAMWDLPLPKWKVCHLDTCIYILLFLALNVAILMYMLGIAGAGIITIQIGWLMNRHPLVSTQSAVWECSWEPFCRWQQSTERIWQGRRALIEYNGIFEFTIIYNLWTL